MSDQPAGPAEGAPEPGPSAGKAGSAEAVGVLAEERGLAEHGASLLKRYAPEDMEGRALYAQLVERLDLDLPFRGLVGLGADDPVWDATTAARQQAEHMPAVASPATRSRTPLRSRSHPHMHALPLESTLASVQDPARIREPSCWRAAWMQRDARAVLPGRCS